MTGNSHSKFSPRGIVTRTMVSTPVSKVIDWHAGRGRLRSHGTPVDMNHADIPAKARAAVFWGLYERTDIKLIREFLDPSSNAINLGAGYGITSVHALAVLNPDRRLLAVEANPEVLPALCHVLANDPRAEVISGAIDYERQDASIAFYPNANMLRAAVLPDGETEAVHVPRVTLSGLVADLRNYSLIMDIEGAETGILWEDETALERCQVIVAELHTRTFRGPTTHRGREVTATDMIARLRDLGFTERKRDRQTWAFTR